MSSDKLTRPREKRDAIATQIRREENRLSREERKKDTRRKILAGAAVLHKADNDSQFKAWLVNNLLEGFLERDDDQALFGLPLAHSRNRKQKSQQNNNAGLLASINPYER